MDKGRPRNYKDLRVNGFCSDMIYKGVLMRECSEKEPQEVPKNKYFTRLLWGCTTWAYKMQSLSHSA